jgi:hypothetical protein
MRLICLALLMAAPLPAAAIDLEFNGNLQFDKRFLVEQDGIPQYPIYHQVVAVMRAFPASEVELKVDARLRNYDFMVVQSAQDLGRADSQYPVDFLLWEAYTDLYGLLGSDMLDIRIGKQRIAWGTADRFNPTDNLNPEDVSDFLNFGERVPTWAILANLNIIEERLKIAFAFVPWPRPILLPRYGGFPLFTAGAALGASLPLPTGVNIVEQNERLKPDRYDMKRTMQAVRVSGTLFTVDWSFSYFHGYDDIPLVGRIDVNFIDQDPTMLQVNTNLLLPEMHVVGADFAGELFGVGWWVETALFLFPHKFYTHIIAPNLSFDQLALDDEPYVKFTAGLDYTFFWETRLHCQYVHGFTVEQGAGNLHPYLILRLEHAFLDDELKVAFGGLWESSYDNPGRDYGVALFPEITWLPFDNVQLSVGYVFIDAGGQALFAPAVDIDQAYLKTKVSF